MKFRYKNYKGVSSDRKAFPLWVFYGKNKYHPKLGWLLLAWDLDKKDFRTFAIKDFITDNN